jgi:hypothetical protein
MIGAMAMRLVNCRSIRSRLRTSVTTCGRTAVTLERSQLCRRALTTFA